MVSPELKVTTEMLWQGALLFLLLDSAFVFLIHRRIHSPSSEDFKKTVAFTTAAVWFFIWTVMAIFFWDPVYRYVFPAWARWCIPPVYGIFFGFLGWLFWWVAEHLRLKPVFTFLLLGGLWGTISHIWAISRGILEGPPMLQGASPVPTVILPFFEFVFYGCIIYSVSVCFYRTFISPEMDTAH